jgi:uncharacterized protein YbjQ (UPF0145 family)
MNKFIRKTSISLVAVAFSVFITGCSTVTVTKTSKGFHEAVSPAEVDILGTVPKADYEEIGIVNANVFGSPETAYNEIRKKASALGANAVILNNQVPMGSRVIVTGTAVRMK